MMVLCRWFQRTHVAYDTVRIAAQLMRYVITGEHSDPEGRVLRGELE